MTDAPSTCAYTSAFHRAARIVALACLPLVVSAARATAQACPDPPLVSVSSSVVPADVCVPSGFGGNPIQFFDDFSWRSFVALVWPALDGQRGTPDPAQTASGKGPRVFETYKLS